MALPPSIGVPSLKIDELGTVAFIGNSIISQLASAASIVLSPSGPAVEGLKFEQIVLLGDQPGPLGHIPTDITKFLKESEPDLVFIQVTQAEPVFRCAGNAVAVRTCQVEGMRKLFGQRLRELMEVVPEKFRSRVVWVSLSAERSLMLNRSQLNMDTYLAADLAAFDVATEGLFALVNVNYGVETDGQYAVVDGERVKYRDVDAVHYCAHGARYVITELFRAVDPSWVTSIVGASELLGQEIDFDRRTWGNKTCTD